MNEVVICRVVNYDSDMNRYEKILCKKDVKYINYDFELDKFEEINLCLKASESTEYFFYIESVVYFDNIYKYLMKFNISFSNILLPKIDPQRIQINSISFVLNEEMLPLPSKELNSEISQKNINLLIEILNKHKIKYFLAFGTLLGFYRDGDFIKHDTDTDIGIFKKEKDKFILAISDLIYSNFKIIRFTENLISIKRENEYIDIYLFKKKQYIIKKIWTCNNYVWPYFSLIKLDTIRINKYNYSIPNYTPKLLKYLYGNTWQTPIKDKHALPLENVNPNLIEKLKFKFQKIL